MLHLKILPTTEITKEIYSNYPHSSEENAGFDLVFPEDFTIKLGVTKLINLGVKIAAYRDNIRVGYLITPRSSIFKTPLRQANSIGVIDRGYNGDLGALVDFYCVDFSTYPNLVYTYNNNTVPIISCSTTDDKVDYYYTQKSNTRLFQIVDPMLYGVTWEIVDTIDETLRNENGFGSSGE